MGIIRMFRDDAALTRVKRTEDAYVYEYLETIHYENAELRREWRRDRRIGFSADGRRAFGRLVANVLVVGALAWVTVQVVVIARRPSVQQAVARTIGGS